MTLDVNKKFDWLMHSFQSQKLWLQLCSVLAALAWAGASVTILIFLYPWALWRRCAAEWRTNSRNILLVSHDASLTGAPISLLTITEELDREKYNPILLSGDDGVLIPKIRQLSVPISILPISQFFQKQSLMTRLRQQTLRLIVSLPFILYLLCKYRVRLIHINTLVTPDAAIAGKMLFVKVVWHIREPIEEGYWAAAQYFFVGKFSNHVICNSDFTKDALARQGIPVSKLTRIHNCVSNRYFRSRWKGRAFRRYLRLVEPCTLIGCVGRVVYEKGQDVFVETAIRLAELHKDAVFVIVGAINNEVYYDRLMSVINQYGMTDRIIFTGVCRDIPEVMAGLDIHVTPSRWNEPFGRVALEAMAAGAVSIVSDMGGLPEVVEDGKSGFVFRSEDVDHLSSIIDRVITNKQVKKATLSAGEKRAHDLFGSSKHVRLVEKTYKEVIGYPDRGE